MKNIFLLGVVSFFLCACVSAPAPIIVKNTPYHELSGFTSPPEAPRAPARQQTSRAQQQDFDSFGHEQMRLQQRAYTPRLRDFRDPMDLLRNSSRRQTEQFFSAGDRSHGAYSRDNYRNSEETDVVYQPAAASQQIRYIAVSVVSVTEAEEQCDYVGVKAGASYSGSAVPAWLDQRNAIAKHTSGQRNSASNTDAYLECRKGGYIVTYVGEHPVTGERFSGTVLSKRQPASSRLNIPFSL